MSSNLSTYELAAAINAVPLPEIHVEEFSVEAATAGECISGALAALSRLKPCDVRALLSELDPADVRARLEATEALKFVEAIRGIE